MSHKVTPYNAASEERGSRLWQVIESHRPESESYALKYSGFILSIPTIYCAVISQRFFNKRFKIGPKAWFMYAPMLVPAVGSGLIHRKLIEDDVLKEEGPGCMGCIEFKAASIHFISGTVWSFLLSSLASCMIASLKKTVYVPPIDKYPLETLKLVGKHFRRFAPTALAITLGNFACVLALTNLEIKQHSQIKLGMLARLSNFDIDVSPEGFDE